MLPLLLTVTTTGCGIILIGCGVAVVVVVVAVAPEGGTGRRIVGLGATVTVGGGDTMRAAASVVAAALASADPIDAISPTAAPTLKARAAIRDPAAGCGRRERLPRAGVRESVIVVT
ncbi:MAG TPA: hypothetical protein VFD97_08860 [Acidimicrobiia bacterium]|nr:hypothetical protein [Acidimicrobiia bacterium]